MSLTLSDIGTAIKTAFTSSGIETPPYEVLKNTEEYEERHYPETTWVSTKVESMVRKDATTTGFWRLFNYIQGKNEKEMKIPMTAPVSVKIVPGAGPNCESTFTISFYVGKDYRENTPKPTNPDVYLETFPEMKLYARVFGGRVSDEHFVAEADNLVKALGDTQDYHQEFFHTAGYDSPYKLFNRRNEVWFIKKEQNE